MRIWSTTSGVIALVSLLLSGCYTVLHHPSDVTLEVVYDEGSDAIPCGECHYESEWFGAYDHPLIWGWPGMVAYDGYTWWDDYYRRPWWYEDYWTDYGRYDESAPTGSGRSVWDKRGLRRGESPSDAPSGGVYPGAPPGGTNPGTPTSPSSESSDPKKTNEPEETHRKKKPRR